MNKKTTFFYGWLILLGGILLMALVQAPLISCAGLFISPITEDLGFSRGAYAFSTTIASLSMAFLSPYMGKLMSGEKMKKVLCISTIGNCIFYFLYSFSSSLWQFYIISILVGVTTCGCTTIAVSTLITNWFKKKHGLAMSIALAGTGLGGTILSSIIGYLIANSGWRSTYQIVGLIRLVILVPFVLFIIRARPSDMGLKRYGEDEDILQTKNAVKKSNEWEPSLKELKGTPLFAAFIVGALLINFTGAAISQIPSAITDAGYSITTASMVASIYLAIAIPGKLILGAVYDKFGAKVGLLFGNTLFFLSVISLLFIEREFVLYVMAVLFGFGTCIATVTGPVITKRFFGVRHYSEIYGFLTLFTSLGYAIAVPAYASVYDFTGSYNAAWVLIASLAVIMTLLLLYCEKTTRHKNLQGN